MTEPKPVSDEPGVLIVIPARGGSKGIPRKNLRPLAGRPLIVHAISTAQASTFRPEVVVTSDDEEILSVARHCGARAILRAGELATDETTLDPVVHDACKQAEAQSGREYHIVVTLQPTSPLLKASSLDAAIAALWSSDAIDTIISAAEDTHLRWVESGEGLVPEYKRRVNRQYLPRAFRETGGFLVTRRRHVSAMGRIGPNVALHVLGGGEQVDIDSYEDWALCEFHKSRRRVLFVVTGNARVGLGHVHNALLLANDILDHQVDFLVDRESELARKQIAARHYPVQVQRSDDILEDIFALGPDVVINDRLDTTREYVDGLRDRGMLVINFEDVGPGAAAADLVINAIYPEVHGIEKQYFGPAYFVLRDEFLLRPPVPIRDRVGKVLLTFGGVDPNNLTRKVAMALGDTCRHAGIELQVVIGMGYRFVESLRGIAGLDIVEHTNCIADYMQGADVIFTSAGRTTYEVASLGVPCIVLAQNAREMTHRFVAPEFGFLHLGLGTQTSDERILDSMRSLVDSVERRQEMQRRMLDLPLRSGRERVRSLLVQAIATAAGPAKA